MKSKRGFASTQTLRALFQPDRISRPQSTPDGFHSASAVEVGRGLHCTTRFQFTNWWLRLVN